MCEVIKSIKEVYDINFRTKKDGGVEFTAPDSWSNHDGYEIVTDKHKYLLLIDNGQCCCENWGYFASNDDFNSFIGKTLYGVDLTDTALNTKQVEEVDEFDLDAGGIQFVNFSMSDGSVLQFAVYNGHNGYYGHPIAFIEDDCLILSDCL